MRRERHTAMGATMAGLLTEGFSNRGWSASCAYASVVTIPASDLAQEKPIRAV